MPDTSQESDENEETNTAPRRSTKIQEQQTNKLVERVFEVAGQQIQKTRNNKRTNQGQSVETRHFVKLLIKRRQQRQQMQFVQRPGANQEGTIKKKTRTDLNEIQDHQLTSQMTIEEVDLFGTPSSMGYCFFQFFHGSRDCQAI